LLMSITQKNDAQLMPYEFFALELRDEFAF